MSSPKSTSPRVRPPGSGSSNWPHPSSTSAGYVGASMRDLVDATGLEKGGIYNHFGSKEQLALEAYDYAMNLVDGRLAASQHADRRRDRSGSQP